MTSKTNLISKIENSEISEAQARAILEILDAGNAPKATFTVNIDRKAAQAQFEAITSTGEFEALRQNVIELRTANSIS